MSKKQKNVVPEYVFQISTCRSIQERGHEQSVHSEHAHAVPSDVDSEDMFTFTPVTNSNYAFQGDQPKVHDRLIKAGEYYKK